MEEEDQIEKEISGSNPSRDSSNQSIKGGSLTSNLFPALDFVKIETVSYTHLTLPTIYSV